MALGLGLLALLSADANGAAPAPVPMPAAPAMDKWEYGEIVFRRNAARNAAAGVPVQNAIRWITAEAELIAQDWDDMAKKLKAPPGNKDAPIATHKFRALNQLGADGWELVGHQPTGGANAIENWTFKRKVKK